MARFGAVAGPAGPAVMVRSSMPMPASKPPSSRSFQRRKRVWPGCQSRPEISAATLVRNSSVLPSRARGGSSPFVTRSRVSSPGETASSSGTAFMSGLVRKFSGVSSGLAVPHAKASRFSYWLAVVVLWSIQISRMNERLSVAMGELVSLTRATPKAMAAVPEPRAPRARSVLPAVP